MVKYYEVIEIFDNLELAHYRGYNFESAQYCYEKNSGNLELREYDFKEQYEIDFENKDYMNAILNGGEKCGYDLKNIKRG